MINPDDRNSQAATAVGVMSSANGGTKSAVENKCVCGWKNCATYQRAFRECQHPVLDGTVKIKLIKGDPECMAYKASLDRTLKVPAAKRNDWKISEGGSSKEFIRYSIARHHFTEKHVMKYLADPKQYSFVKPFSIHGAKKYLFQVDPKESITTDNQDVLYLQTPNVSKEHVKDLFMQLKESLQQQHKQRKTGGAREDMQKEEVVVRGGGGGGMANKKQPSNSSLKGAGVLKKKSATNGNSTMPPSSSSPPPAVRASQPPPAISPNSSDDDDDDVSYDTSSTDSDAMGGRGGASGGSGRARNASAPAGGGAASGGKSAAELLLLQQKEAENRRLREQLESMQGQLTFLHDMVRKLQEEHFENKSVRSGTQRSSTNNRGNAKTTSVHSRSNRPRSGRTASTSMRSSRSGVPHEIELGEDDDGSYIGERGWGAASATGYRGNESGADLDWSEHYDEDEADMDDNQTTGTFQVTYQAEHSQRGGRKMSRRYSNGTQASRATSIVSASKSVKSLPREIELDEDEDDDEDHESLEEEAFETRSLASSNRAGAVGSSNRSTSDHGKDPRRLSLGPSAKKPSRRKSVGGSSRHSRSKNYEDDDKSIHSSVSRAGDDRSVVSNAGTYQVTNLEVTDPYGEKGTYTGSISNSTGMPHGFGRLEYERAGRWYEGDWKHGRWTGQGRLSNGDGDFYEGSLKNDHKHGFGVMKFADGRTFEGEYINGQMIEGKMTYQDGSTYSGTWVDGMRHGRGKCVFTDNSIYEGEFKEGEFFGYGKMSWSDGGWYEGEWWNGEMHGKGKEVRPDGTLRHDGEWSKGQPIRK